MRKRTVDLKEDFHARIQNFFSKEGLSSEGYLSWPELEWWWWKLLKCKFKKLYFWGGGGGTFEYLHNKALFCISYGSLNIDF